ncbi:MAG: RNA polymerase sigma factor [Nocardioidaceae bacterium]
MTSEEKKRLFRAIFDENHLPLLAYALRRTPDACDAAEVLADTMLVAWRRIEEVPAGEETRPWLYGVARRVLGNRRRGDERRQRLTDRLALEIGELVVNPTDLVPDQL